jgi:AcrR family transcriptional regulator
VATSIAPQRLSSIERRQAIIQTAIRLFAQTGFRGTTTRELAQAVGVSEPVLYQHFPSKSDLYKAIIETLMERVDEAQWDGSGQPLSEYLTGLALGILRFYETNSDHIRILIFSGLEGHELSRIFHDRHACHVFEALSRGFRQRMEAGDLRGDLDPMLTARAFLMMIGDVGLKRVIVPTAESDEERQRLVDQMVNIFLHGIQRFQ